MGYATARILWNGLFDHKRTAMIAPCQSVDDVRNSVMFAAERGLLVSVKGGGHSFPGKSTSDGGMMIDMSQMHSASVDADARTAHMGGGALLGHLDNAAPEHEMITTTGIVVRNNLLYRNERAGMVFGGFEQAAGRAGALPGSRARLTSHCSLSTSTNGLNEERATRGWLFHTPYPSLGP